MKFFSTARKNTYAGSEGSDPFLKRLAKWTYRVLMLFLLAIILTVIVTVSRALRAKDDCGQLADIARHVPSLAISGFGFTHDDFAWAIMQLGGGNCKPKVQVNVLRSCADGTATESREQKTRFQETARISIEVDSKGRILDKLTFYMRPGTLAGPLNSGAYVVFDSIGDQIEGPVVTQFQQSIDPAFWEVKYEVPYTIRGQKQFNFRYFAVDHRGSGTTCQQSKPTALMASYQVEFDSPIGLQKLQIHSACVTYDERPHTTFLFNFPFAFYYSTQAVARYLGSNPKDPTFDLDSFREPEQPIDWCRSS